jgi:hypothetical protein
MARLECKNPKENGVCITEKTHDLFPEQTLHFEDINFYFHEFGVSICSAKVNIKQKDGIKISEIDEISESLNGFFKDYFQKISYQLAKVYRKVIHELDIPSYQFDFFPQIENIDKEKHFIPWTHRVYHIQDDEIFHLENPGKPFQFLLTPSKKMDVQDLSIYDNRYIYFGWGHSLILQSNHQDGFSQTNCPVCDYVRLIEIAQANWSNLEILADLVDITHASFHDHYGKMRTKELSKRIDKIHVFKRALSRILDYYQGVKITFDTEKRILLKELNERWLTQNMYDKLLLRLNEIEALLEDLYDKEKERREEALNIIALLFTIISIVDIIAVIIDIINPSLGPLSIILIILGITFIVVLAIILFLKFGKRN